MIVIKNLIKTVVWSAAIAVFIRIVFGLYSVFGAITLLLPLSIGFICALSISSSSNVGLTIFSLLHMALTCGFYSFFDYSGMLLTLASDTADFFARFSVSDDTRVNILWCILFVMPVYFFSFIVSSGIITSVKIRRKKIRYESDEETLEDAADTDEVTYTE